MKTLTLLKAYDYSSWLYSQFDGEDERLQRQVETFRVALLSRIEQGDRAREALRQVEWVDFDYDDFCPWCDQSIKRGHKPDCPRQLALGIEPKNEN